MGLLAFTRKAATSEFTISRYGAQEGQDVTSALQQAVNACVAAGGGTVLIDVTRESFLDGARTSGENGLNAQIVIPLVGKGDQCTVLVRGIAPPNLSTEGIASLRRSPSGSILTSRNTNAGFVFGTRSADTGVTGIRNYVCVIFQDFEIRTQPGTNGVDFKRLIQFQFRGTWKTTIVTPLFDTTKPTGTYGIIMPDVNNKLHLEGAGTVMAEGYERDLTVGEHTCIYHYATLGSVYGLCVPAGINYHSVNIFQYSCETSNYGFLFEGTAHVNIFGYDTEHLSGSGKWYDFVADVVRTAGDSRLYISNCTVVKSNVGHTNEFITSGSPDVRILVGAGANMLSSGTTTTTPTTTTDTTGNTTPQSGTPYSSVIEDNFTTSDYEGYDQTYFEAVVGFAPQKSNGRLSLAPTPNTNSKFGGITTVSTYNVQGGAAETYLYQPLNNFAPCDQQLVYGRSSNHFVRILLEGRTLLCQINTPATGQKLTPVNVAYDAAKHQYWRLRNQGGYWWFDFSGDGSTWTNLGKTPTVSDLDGTQGKLSLSAGTYDASVSSPGTALFENLFLKKYS